MKYEDFYKKINLLRLDDRKPYIKYMDEILNNPDYRTVLFFDEIDTELIRMCWNPDKEKRMTQPDARQILGISSNVVSKRLNNIYLNWSSQISLTYSYYKEHKFSSKLLSSFKKNIENINIDERIKKLSLMN